MQNGNLGQIFSQATPLYVKCKADNKDTNLLDKKCQKLDNKKKGVDNKEFVAKRKAAEREGWLQKSGCNPVKIPNGLSTTPCINHIVHRQWCKFHLKSG
eukprot:8053894-Ditylum_brightwellii.AAC.1